MDFKDGFEWTIIGFFLVLTSSIIIPILKLVGVLKLNWWICMIPLISIFLLFCLVHLFFMISLSGLEEEYEYYPK